MTWGVIWLNAAMSDLARHYLSGRTDVDPNAITRAMAEIDRVIEVDPTQAGESRAGNERLLIVRPLSVYFELYPDQRAAVVTRVVYNPPR